MILRIVGPPLILADMSERDKAAEYKKYQMAMHDVIVRLAPGIEGLIFDLFTSRAELTDLGFPASITYVRFPYYLGTSVVTLCGELNMASLGQYALKADFYFGNGRMKLTRSKRPSPSYTPFELTVGGVPIPHLSADERKQINGQKQKYNQKQIRCHIHISRKQIQNKNQK